MDIKMLVMDVDGTLTDGKIYMGQDGELCKAFSVKDGTAILSLADKEIIPVIITCRYSKIVENRAKELRIDELHQNVINKLDELKRVMKKYNCEPQNVAYIGDDINDLECISYCGLSACPCDAVEMVRNCADYVCAKKGGEGAVREFIEECFYE